MAQDPAPTITALDHLVLTVADIPITCTFYESMLGMTPIHFPVADGSTRTALKFGHQKINLHQAGHEFHPKAMSPTPGSADLCFLTQTPLADWITHLTDLNVPIELGPIARTGATGPITSVYVRDPDENLIEISVLS